MTSLQVLVVDDEPAIRQVVAAQLRKAGHTVEQAIDGEAAMERLAKGDVDIVLCDIKLPGLSGIEILRQARAAGIDTAFIMMTAFASVDTAIEAIKAGAADYMIKPLNNEELLHRLTKVATCAVCARKIGCCAGWCWASTRKCSALTLRPCARWSTWPPRYRLPTAQYSSPVRAAREKEWSHA